MKPPRKILVLDDEESILEILQLTLENEGYQILPARNGKEGMEILKEDPAPFLILLDLMMPLMDGWAFLRARAGDPIVSKIPVIAISAHVDRFASVQAEEHLEKPIRLEDLMRLVRKYDSKSREHA